MHLTKIVDECHSTSNMRQTNQHVNRPKVNCKLELARLLLGLTWRCHLGGHQSRRVVYIVVMHSAAGSLPPGHETSAQVLLGCCASSRRRCLAPIAATAESSVDKPSNLSLSLYLSLSLSLSLVSSSSATLTSSSSASLPSFAPSR